MHYCCVGSIRSAFTKPWSKSSAHRCVLTFFISRSISLYMSCCCSVTLTIAGTVGAAGMGLLWKVASLSLDKCTRRPLSNPLLRQHRFKANTFHHKCYEILSALFLAKWSDPHFALACAQLYSMPSPANSQWNFGVKRTRKPSCLPRNCKNAVSSSESVHCPIRACSNDASTESCLQIFPSFNCVE